jgi:hypothetical protein
MFASSCFPSDFVLWKLAVLSLRGLGLFNKYIDIVNYAIGLNNCNNRWFRLSPYSSFIIGSGSLKLFISVTMTPDRVIAIENKVVRCCASLFLDNKNNRCSEPGND